MKIHIPGLDSRKVQVRIEFEASVETTTPIIGGKPESGRIVRVRMEDGRWLRKDTWIRRVEALGIKFDETTLKDAADGDHTPEGANR